MTYSIDTAITLNQLAQLSTMDSSGGGITPPAGWTIADQASGSMSGIQMMILKGTINGASATVLSIGYNLKKTMNFYGPQYFFLYPVPSSITGASSDMEAAIKATVHSEETDPPIKRADVLSVHRKPGVVTAAEDARSPNFVKRAKAQALAELHMATFATAQVQYGALYSYQEIRQQLWTSLANLAPITGAFFITARTMGAMPTQIAFLDLLPSRTSPVSPVSSLAGYMFSMPSVGNEAFKNLVNGANYSLYNVHYENDPYPDEPDNSQGYFSPGTPENVVDSSPPNTASPWWQQSTPNYNNLLTKQQIMLQTRIPAAAMYRGDLHVLARNASGEIHHQCYGRILSSIPVCHAWQSAGQASDMPVLAATNDGLRLAYREDQTVVAKDYTDGGWGEAIVVPIDGSVKGPVTRVHLDGAIELSEGQGQRFLLTVGTGAVRLAAMGEKTQAVKAFPAYDFSEPLLAVPVWADPECRIAVAITNSGRLIWSVDGGGWQRLPRMVHTDETGIPHGVSQEQINAAALRFESKGE